MNMHAILDTKNKTLIGHFYKWLGSRFKELHEASEGAPITCMAVDEDGKEYYVRIVYNEGTSSSSIEYSGTRIENTVFYQLYSMVSEGLNVFHFECFADGYCLWYLNDSTPESIKVVDDYTLIGISSCLHHEYPKVTPTAEPRYTYINPTVKLPKLKQVKKD